MLARAIAQACALLLLGCDPSGCDSAARGEAAPSQATRSKPSAQAGATGLPALQRARLDYLFEAAERVASDWPWLANERVCVMLLDLHAQWTVNCEDAPDASFARLAEPYRGHPVYERRGGTFLSAGREQSTAELLSTMPAAAHVDEPGSRGSALTPHHPWLLLGTLEALTAHHAAFARATTDEWLSVALHELFHARQMRDPAFGAELRAINSGAVAPAPLIRLFTDDARYRLHVEREYELLVQAASHPDRSAEAARSALRRWYALYKKRCAELSAKKGGAELIRSDSLFSYVEGVARYVESKFLVQTDQHPPRAIPADLRFNHFERFNGRGYAGMNNRQLDAQYFYAIGFHLALLLDDVDAEWRACVHRQPGWLLGMITRLATDSNARPCP